MGILRLKGDKIVEEWAEINLLSIFNQIKPLSQDSCLESKQLNDGIHETIAEIVRVFIFAT